MFTCKCNISAAGGDGQVVQWYWFNFPFWGILLILDNIRQGPTALAVGASGGSLDIFFSCLSLLSSFSLSLGGGPINTEILSQTQNNLQSIYRWLELNAIFLTTFSSLHLNLCFKLQKIATVRSQGYFLCTEFDLSDLTCFLFVFFFSAQDVCRRFCLACLL